MAYGISEYPHTSSNDMDLRELIHIYRELRDKYDGTYKLITQLTERLDKYEQEVQKQIDGIVESKINQYKASVDTIISNRFATELAKINASIQKHKDDVNNQYNTFTSTINSIISDMQSDIDSIAKTANDTVNANNAFRENTAKRQEAYELYIDGFIATFVDEVNSDIKNLLLNIPLHLDSVKWLWQNVLFTLGFSAIDWYKYSEITCGDWNTSKITCEDWYTNGKYIFDWYNSQSKHLSPISGELLHVYEIVLELVSKLKINALTAEEYDNLKLTAGETNAIFGTLGEYDWNGRLLYMETDMFDSRTEERE